MDRKTQVRAIIAHRFPEIPQSDRQEIIDLVWKEAQRELKAKL